MHTGIRWRILPHEFSHREVVYQQCRHWLAAWRFETSQEDLRLLLRLTATRQGSPTNDGIPCVPQEFR